MHGNEKLVLIMLNNVTKCNYLVVDTNYVFKIHIWKYGVYLDI